MAVTSYTPEQSANAKALHGGVRFALEVAKYLKRRPAERLFDHRQEIVKRHWRHVTVQYTLSVIPEAERGAVRRAA